MTNQRNRILAELDKQSQYEGETDNIVACRVVLRHVKTDQDFMTLISIHHHHYGKFSYETHRFYYLKPWVTRLVTDLALLTNKKSPMTRTEHFARVIRGDISPRIVEYNPGTGNTLYVAWTPTWKGPARPDYAAALADLNDRLRETP